MTITIFICVIGLTLLTCIYNSFLLLSILYCLLPLTSTSAGHGSLPGVVTQTFIPEGSGPLVVLPGLSCCSFSLALVTGLGEPYGLFQAYSSLPPLWVAVQFPPVVWINHPSQLLSLSVDSEEWGAQSGRGAILTSSSMESLLCLPVKAFLSLELRPLDQQGIKS